MADAAFQPPQVALVDDLYALLARGESQPDNTQSCRRSEMPTGMSDLRGADKFSAYSRMSAESISNCSIIAHKRRSLDDGIDPAELARKC